MNNILRGSTDFNRVRDGRNSPDAYIDIALDLAGDQIFNIAGNSFYVDANPSDGNAVVFFQETDNLRGPTPFYVSPGFIARIPFTQIRVVNASQPGRKIRLVYGVDTDFQPGSVSQVSFAGNVNINGATYNASTVLNALSVGSATVIVPPAANTNGIILSNLSMSYFATTNGASTLLAKSSAPATAIDGDGLGVGQAQPGTSNVFNFSLINPLFIAPGKGVYAFVLAGSVLTGTPLITATWQQ